MSGVEQNVDELRSARFSLLRHWTEAEAHWHDSACRHFEKAYWEELLRASNDTLRAAEKLNNVLEQALGETE